MTTELQLLKKGEGKIKSRAFFKDGKLVWKKFEDPWSPLVSDREDNTEDHVESRGDEDLGDNGAPSDDEPKRHKRMRSENEGDSEDDRPRDDKRKRAY